MSILRAICWYTRPRTLSTHMHMTLKCSLLSGRYNSYTEYAYQMKTRPKWRIQYQLVFRNWTEATCMFPYHRGNGCIHEACQPKKLHGTRTPAVQGHYRILLLYTCFMCNHIHRLLTQSSKRWPPHCLMFGNVECEQVELLHGELVAKMFNLHKEDW